MLTISLHPNSTAGQKAIGKPIITWLSPSSGIRGRIQWWKLCDANNVAASSVTSCFTPSWSPSWTHGYAIYSQFASSAPKLTVTKSGKFCWHSNEVWLMLQSQYFQFNLWNRLRSWYGLHIEREAWARTASHKKHCLKTYLWYVNSVVLYTPQACQRVQRFVQVVHSVVAEHKYCWVGQVLLGQLMKSCTQAAIDFKFLTNSI